MLSKEEIRKHYIFSTTHELDDHNKMLRQYVIDLENKVDQLESAKEIKEALELVNIDIKALINMKYENKRLKSGINSLMQSRKKWKNRYYKIRKKHKKLIEKLENDIENSTKSLDTNILLIKEYYKNKLDYAQEILSILKGENDDYKNNNRKN